MANNADTSRRELARLAQHPDPLISRLVGQRDHLPVTVQRICARSTDEPTRRSIALNATADADVLDWLATDISADVRAAVAANANTTTATLTRLHLDNHWDVAVAVIANPNTDPALRPQLLAAAVRHGDAALLADASAAWPDTVIDTVTLLSAPDTTVGPRDALDVATTLTS
jgi:hypothetical protein